MTKRKYPNITHNAIFDFMPFEVVCLSPEISKHFAVPLQVYVKILDDLVKEGVIKKVAKRVVINGRSVGRVGWIKCKERRNTTPSRSCEQQTLSTSIASRRPGPDMTGIIKGYSITLAIPERRNT